MFSFTLNFGTLVANQLWGTVVFGDCELFERCGAMTVEVNFELA